MIGQLGLEESLLDLALRCSWGDVEFLGADRFEKDDPVELIYRSEEEGCTFRVRVLEDGKVRVRPAMRERQTVTLEGAEAHARLWEEMAKDEASGIQNRLYLLDSKRFKVRGSRISKEHSLGKGFEVYEASWGRAGRWFFEQVEGRLEKFETLESIWLTREGSGKIFLKGGKDKSFERNHLYTEFYVKLYGGAWFLEMIASEREGYSLFKTPCGGTVKFTWDSEALKLCVENLVQG